MMKKMNKRGAFTDIFIFMIVAIIITFISGIFIYIGATTQDQLLTELSGAEISENTNYTDIVNNTFGDVNVAYQSLYWITLFIITGMIISIFIGSFMITTRPIFFVPYIFISIIAILVSAGVSNAYQLATATPELAETFGGFVGTNFVLNFLPVWVTVIVFMGGIIMFARMQAHDGQFGGGF